MDEFTLGKYPQSSVLVVYSERDEIELAPEYQRISGIWTHEKRQLLLDSLLNGFDVPKLYFHEFVPPKHKAGKTYRYAIIDGKQRLQTIWDFIDGQINLAEDFEYLRDDKVKAEGFDYQTLAQKYPQIKSRFDATPLDIVTIRTNDIELIEDMFSRLNEAVPLNAPEKRNAFGGPIPVAIRKLATHDFFSKRLPFTDNRYRHRDLVAKFLYLEHEDGIANTKKADLDAFVLHFRQWRKEGKAKGSASAVTTLVTKCQAVLDRMTAVFVKSDSLLRQVGMVTLYYHLYRQVEAELVDPVKRELLVRFEKVRAENREKAETEGEAGANVDLDLLEFDKHSQSPNDAYAIRIRLGVLLKYLKKKSGINYDKAVIATPE
jgi:uncharacterized protein DUF262